MAKEPSKTNLRARTEDLRREIEASSGGAVWQRPMRVRNFFWAVLVWMVFVMVVRNYLINDRTRNSGPIRFD